MGKMTLQVEVDEAVVRDLEARGIDPLRFAEVGFSDAYARAKRLSLVDSAREKAKDPEGAARRAKAWAEENRDAIAQFNAHVREHGCSRSTNPSFLTGSAEAFDVFGNPAQTSTTAPFIVELSSHLIELEAVLVAPLVQGPPPVTMAELQVVFEDAPFALRSSPWPRSRAVRLRRSVGSLASYEAEIRRGIDQLFTGF